MGHMSKRDDSLDVMVGYRICEKKDGKLLTLFHGTNVLVECRVKDIWKKNHSRSNVYLARYMKITRELEQLYITNNR